MNFSRIMAHKNTRVFSHEKVENKLFKASVFWMNDSRIHWNMKTLVMTALQNSAAVTDVTFHSTHRKGYQSKLLFFTRRAADVVSEACFTVMTGDHHNERAATDFSLIIFAQTPLWLVWILTVMLVWLYFSSFLFCFLTLNFISYTSVSCVW